MSILVAGPQRLSNWPSSLDEVNLKWAVRLSFVILTGFSFTMSHLLIKLHHQTKTMASALQIPRHAMSWTCELFQHFVGF